MLPGLKGIILAQENCSRNVSFTTSRSKIRGVQVCVYTQMHTLSSCSSRILCELGKYISVMIQREWVTALYQMAWLWHKHSPTLPLLGQSRKVSARFSKAMLGLLIPSSYQVSRAPSPPNSGGLPYLSPEPTHAIVWLCVCNPQWLQSPWGWGWVLLTFSPLITAK